MEELNKLRSRNRVSDIIITKEKNGYTYIYSNYLHYVSFHGAQSHKGELPGAPAGNTEPDHSQQAVEPREAEQPNSPEHTKAHRDTTHQIHSVICRGYKLT